MAFSNYNELQTMIADYILRPDAPIKTFIALGERDVAPSVRHYLQETTTTLTSADNGVTLPADLQETRRIIIDDILATPVSAYDPTVGPGDIGYFQRGNTYRIVPEQTDPRSVELIYYARVPALSDAAPTNWLLTNFPDVLFHAALVRAYRWLKDEKAEAAESASLKLAIGNLIADHKRAVNSGNKFDIDFGGPIL